METKHLLVAIRAALEAGQEILNIYNDPNQDFEIERKADNSPLTIADRKAHSVIAARLQATPYPVLSEEGKHLPYEVRRSWSALWVVDPLDGTKEFIKRNGEFSVNIAYVLDSQPMAGVIYFPVGRTLYFADVDKGAYRLDDVTGIGDMDFDALTAAAEPLPIKTKHDAYVIVASRSHLTPETVAFIDGKRREHERVETLFGGSSLKICRVAEGTADVYPRFGPTMEWDTAAGHAIVRAAGGEIRHTDSPNPLTYNKEDLHNPWFIVEGKGE